MKQWMLSVLALGFATSAVGQELPQPSPTSTVSQRVGLTDISVTYSRPSAKGRTIFGDLVPYNQVWRTGANACTKVSFSSKVMVDGKSVDAGEYALFTIPGKDSWTVILSNQTSLWGSSGYNESGDVLRIMSMPKKSDFDETFAIGFENLSTDGASLVMEWANTEVAIPITVDSKGQSEKNVAQALADANRSYRNAADFYSGNGDHENAIATIDMAIQLDPNNWYTNWVKAEILHAAGKNKEAKKQGKAAIDMGQAYYDSRSMPFTYREGLEKDMKKWK